MNHDSRVYQGGDKIRGKALNKKALILLLGLSLCLANGFADEVLVDEVQEPIYEFPTAEGDEYIQGTEDFIRKTPEFIFGSADYEKMRDLPKDSQDYQLGRKVAHLFTGIEPGSPHGFICTGFLVGPDLLMTNHHCVHSDYGQPADLELMAVYMDYYQEFRDDPTKGGVTAGVIAILKADARLDYALLRLDKPIGNTYGWLELDTTTLVTPGQSVKLIHHSAGRSKEISRRNSQIVKPSQDIADRYPFLIAYLADTEPGSSGCPIFLRDGTGVIGINHSQWWNADGPIFNGGSLMSWIVPRIEQYLPKGPAPDLVTESARVDKAYLRPGESFTLSVTVRNQGTTASPTTLRYYYSTDDTILMSDEPVGTDIVGSLPPDGTIETSITLTAPDYVGTYYYGACVDAVDNESATYNNCSVGASINVSNTPPFWIYWTQNNRNIQRTTSDGIHQQALVTGVIAIKDIALDVAGGKMYWTTYSIGKKIQRANLNGSNVEDVITELGEPLAIALDVTNQKIYWTESHPSKICRANFDGSNVEVLVRGLNTPLGIALDITAGKVYWTNWGPDLIQRANLDGSNVEVLISGLYRPIGIALDIVNGKMYWVDTGSDNAGDTGKGKVQRANLDGSNVEDLVSGLDQPYGIALDVPNRKMYWTDWWAGLIQRANLDGSHVEDLITSANPFYLALGISQIEPPTPPGPGPGPSPGSLDVNGDGQVTVMDLVAVALFYGTQVPSGIDLPADVNDDGVINVLDLTAVAQGIDAARSDLHGISLEAVEAALLAAAEQKAAGAPNALFRGTVYRNVTAALADARKLDERIPEVVLKVILQLLSEMGAVPEETALLPNYPNPFNPETWIPYHLATDAEVTLTIYDMQGVAVRALMLGDQPAGIYQSKHRAAYWDGRNDKGEKVSSGVYFYTLTAGDFTATRKLLIIK